jgi:hypothetical protein
MMGAIDFTGIKKEAMAAQKRGGTDAKHAGLVLRLLGRILELESELQAARQLKLFGDVPPPPKTPIGI